MLRTLMVVTGALVLLGVAARQPSAQVPATSAYVGANTCRDCHPDIHKAWAATKHSRAFERLDKGDREGGVCIKCHVTGTPEMIAAEGGKPSFPGVQCESCHGAGRPHVEAARAGDPTDARTTPVDEKTCLKCHNETSPHYKPFFFNALAPLVHRVG